MPDRQTSVLRREGVCPSQDNLGYISTQNLSGFNRTKLKQDGGNPVRLIQDLLQAHVMHVSKIDDLRRNHQQHVPHEPECEDSCAMITLVIDQLLDDLQSKISGQTQQQFGQNNLS